MRLTRTHVIASRPFFPACGGVWVSGWMGWDGMGWKLLSLITTIGKK